MNPSSSSQITNPSSYELSYPSTTTQFHFHSSYYSLFFTITIFQLSKLQQLHYIQVTKCYRGICSNLDATFINSKKVRDLLVKIYSLLPTTSLLPKSFKVDNTDQLGEQCRSNANKYIISSSSIHNPDPS